MITIFGHDCGLVSGKTMQLGIDVFAQQPIQAYSAYQYFGVHTYMGKRSPVLWESGEGGSALEWLCRDRRTILFADTTQLTPCRIRSKRCDRLLDQIKAHMWMDHVSFWQSTAGAIFILNEPYRISAKDLAALRAASFAVFQVPTNLAPYCGRWDAQPGVLPMTTSFLITEAKNASELIAIEQRLKRANESVAPWNSLLGVYYVQL